MIKSNKRKAFAMIMAMGVIVLIAGMMAASLSFSSQTSKQSSDIYLREQAELYAKSAAEFALLDIASRAPCTGAAGFNIPFGIGGIFNINVTYQFVYDVACGGGIDYTQVTTADQNGSVLLDITVTTNEGTEPIRIFRRTIQKL